MGNFQPIKDALSYTHVTRITCYKINTGWLGCGGAARGCIPRWYPVIIYRTSGVQQRWNVSWY